MKTSYDNPNITVVLTDVKNSRKQVNIANWLNEEMSTAMFMYRAFIDYNPDYPNKTDRIISFGEKFFHTDTIQFGGHNYS